MISIRAEEVGKAYNFYKKPTDSLKELLLRRPCHETFWALRGISFALSGGAALGIVGDNGAGKTTLLQLLAGTIAPTTGSVERNGRVAAIIELGAGFHPELSGRENIRIGCAVLGLSPGETSRRLPEIIAFSELDSFIDRPLKTYSSGMYLRLSFAVATTIEPDILLVDEHLSVGDQHFRKKCMDRIASFLNAGKTLVFCSHDFYALREICDRCLWLRAGRTEMFGPATKVLDSYQNDLRTRDGAEAPRRTMASEIIPDGPPLGGETCLREVTLEGDCRNGAMETGGTLIVRVSARLSPAEIEAGVHVGVLIERNDKIWCYGISTAMDGLDEKSALYPLGSQEYGIRFVVPQIPLLAGQYSLSVALLDGGTPHVYDMWAGIAPFSVRQNSREVGVARFIHRWEKP
jgi:lipopolysaccharide transport system ATP-binding protein